MRNVWKKMLIRTNNGKVADVEIFNLLEMRIVVDVPIFVILGHVPYGLVARDDAFETIESVGDTKELPDDGSGSKKRKRPPECVEWGFPVDSPQSTLE